MREYGEDLRERRREGDANCIADEIKFAIIFPLSYEAHARRTEAHKSLTHCLGSFGVKGKGRCCKKGRRDVLHDVAIGL